MPHSFQEQQTPGREGLGFVVLRPFYLQEKDIFVAMKALLFYNRTLESAIKRHILILILAFGMSGCAALTKPGGLFYPSGQQAKLSKAVTLLKQGDSSAATGVLQDICAEPAVLGVTDEALFLLAILRLGSDMDTNRIVQAQDDMEKLVTDYPTSSWSPLASSLVGFLATVQEARQQEDMLNERNLLLERENKELKGINITQATELVTQSKELQAVKVSNLSLSKENSRLREIIGKLRSEKLKLSDIIEQLKNLDRELESKDRDETGVSPR